MFIGLGGLPGEDLVYVADNIREQSDLLGNARILVTGATGFVGRWLVASLAQARHQLDLPGLSIQVLVRDVKSARSRLGVDLWKELSVVEADINMEWSITEFPTHVIHGATPSSLRSGSADGKGVLLTSVLGTHNLLRALRKHEGIPRVLHLSSGAVYGPQPLDLARIPEGWVGGPSPLVGTAPYTEGKRAAEALLEVATRENSISAVHARLFAFMGPGLPVEDNFAIGNFARDASRRDTIQVHGDGKTVRSYLDARDLAVWLIRLLFVGKAGTSYNVGSPDGFTLGEWAERCAALAEIDVQVGSSPIGERSRYVPDISNSDILGITPCFRDPDFALASWIKWLASS